MITIIMTILVILYSVTFYLLSQNDKDHVRGDWDPDALSEVGGESHWEIVSCRAVRACVRAVWLPSGIGSQKRSPTLSLFPLGAPSFSFSLLGATSFPFSLHSASRTSYPTLVGLIGNYGK